MLLPQHLADLKKSGIDETTALENGFTSVSDPRRIAQILAWDQRAGRFAKELGPCLVIRYYDSHGNITKHTRLKPDVPKKYQDGKSAKYLGPKGKPNQIYFPKGIAAALTQPTTSLLITEGEKKALCAQLHGYACLGLAGVECWSKPQQRDLSGNQTGDRKLHQSLDDIRWKDRHVYIVFDSDRRQKPEVRRAESALARALQDAGALVRVVQLPDGPAGADGLPTKQGLDDFLVKHGAEALHPLIAEARFPEVLGPRTREETGGLCNYFIEEAEKPKPGEKKKKDKVIAKPLKCILSDCMSKTQGWPKRVGNLLFSVRDYQPQYLENTHALMAFLGCTVPRRELEPKAHPIDWQSGSSLVTQPQFFAAMQQYAEAYQAIECQPHEPMLDGHYYAHPPVTGGDGAALFGLLRRFSPATAEDGDLILAFLLTLVAGVPYGQRPAWLITAAEQDEKAGRGVGKTTLVRIASMLVGDTISYSAQETLPEFVKRLLSPEGRDKRVVLIDNIKSHKFSSADLESLITCQTISGRQLYVGEGRRPNTLIWCLTINGASLSKDLAQRIVTIQLRRPSYTGNWEAETLNYVQSHRHAILGDLVARLKVSVPALTNVSRWGHWEQAVLARLHDPQRLQEVIRERQATIDDDEEDKDIILEAIYHRIRGDGHVPDQACVLITSKDMAVIINEALNEQLPVNRASSFVKTLGIPELRKSDRGCARGWIWCGREATLGTPQRLNVN